MSWDLANLFEIGLFLGSGKVLASAGPGGAVLAYAIMGTVISSVISSVGEMTALMPVNAPMMEFPRRFLDRGVGFAVGWVYWYAFPRYSLGIVLMIVMQVLLCHHGCRSNSHCGICHSISVR